MNNQPPALPKGFLFAGQELGSFGYILFVGYHLLNSELSVFLQLLFFAFSLIMLMSFIGGYNFFLIEKENKKAREINGFDVVTEDVHTMVAKQFVWSSILTLGIAFWLFVGLIIRHLA